MPITRWNHDKKEYETFAHGAVLKTGNRSYQIMSDIWGTARYADYWDELSNCVKSCNFDIYEYTRDPVTSQCHAEVDATDEVRAKVFDVLYARNLDKVRADMERKNREISKGSEVTVVAGRSNKGTKGKVVVKIVRPYKMGWKSNDEYKLGIATSDVMVDVAAANGKVYKNHRDMVWAWERNCEPTTIPAINEAEAKEIARGMTTREMEYNYAKK